MAVLIRRFPLRLERFQFKCVQRAEAATRDVPRPSRPCSGTEGTPVARNLMEAVKSKPP